MLFQTRMIFFLLLNSKAYICQTSHCLFLHAIKQLFYNSLAPPNCLKWSYGPVFMVLFLLWQQEHTVHSKEKSQCKLSSKHLLCSRKESQMVWNELKVIQLNHFNLFHHFWVSYSCKSDLLVNAPCRPLDTYFILLTHTLKWFLIFTL